MRAQSHPPVLSNEAVDGGGTRPAHQLMTTTLPRLLELSAFCLVLPDSPKYEEWVSLRKLAQHVGFSTFQTAFCVLATILCLSHLAIGFIARCSLRNHFPIHWPVAYVQRVHRCAGRVASCGMRVR